MADTVDEEDSSYRALARSDGFGYLVIFCAGVWLFAADRLLLSTLIHQIISDIGGAHLVGWAGAMFEAAAIVAGMMSAFMVRQWGMRYAYSGCALGFVIGCAISAVAPDMMTFQLGRFCQALFGSAFVTLTAIAVANIFSNALLARAMSVVSIVWGFAAFSGPLVGGVFAEFANWRMAFAFAAVLGGIVTMLSFVVLAGHKQLSRPSNEKATESFPLVRMLLLFGGVMAIATAGIRFSAIFTPAMIVVGLILLVMFWRNDRKKGERRLAPLDALRLNTRVGAAVYLNLFLSSSVISMMVFGPVLLAIVYGLPPLTIGYMIFAVSLGWSATEVVCSGVPEAKAGGLIFAGAAAITLSVILYNFAFQFDLIWLFALGFLCQGAGFGMSWAQIIRRTVQHPDPLEKNRIAGSTHTIQRIGFALGVATTGIFANALGFSDTMNAATAHDVGSWIVRLSLPLAFIGLAAAFVFVRMGPVAKPAVAIGV